MLEATYFDLDELLECMHPENPKDHDIGAIGGGISDLGFIERVVRNWRTMNLVAGHGRIETLDQQRRAGETPDNVEIVKDEDGVLRWLVPGDWCDISPAQERRALATLNRTTEQGGWDDVKLAQLLNEILHEDGQPALEATGFDEDDLQSLISDLEQMADHGSDPGPAPEEAGPVLAEKWGTEIGQLWTLGKHRLIIGDSTDDRITKRLLGGRKVDIVLTDPPYSSGGFQDGQKRQSSSIGTRQGASIARDNLTTKGYEKLIGRILGNVDAETVYMFCDWRMWDVTRAILESSGYPVRNMLVWDKGTMGMGFPWRSQHELIAFAKRSAAQMMDGSKGNVLQAGRTGNENHPTEKPVDLLAEIIENTKGRTVYDPCGGSGSTLIACEKQGRACRIIEVVPEYAAAILERWAEMTGRVPVLETES